MILCIEWTTRLSALKDPERILETISRLVCKLAQNNTYGTIRL